MKSRTGWRGLLALAALGLASAASAQQKITELPNGPGVKLVYAKCQTCHSLQYVTEAKGLVPNQWKSLIASMKDYGLEISPQDEKTVLAYLTTYLGPNPPPAAAPATAAAPEKVDGKTVFAQSCAACHGAEGAGQPGYYPPLAGNPDLFASRDFPVLVVLNGITGPIKVKGDSYDGSMPSFSHLSDAEIAAAVNYVRGAWGNPPAGATAPEAVTADLVKRLRGKPLSPEKVHALREAAE